MNKISGCLLLLTVSPLAAPAQPPPPILDMHLHAKDAPDPEREPPPKLCLPLTVYGVVDPQCTEPLVAPATDREMVARTVEILERRNVYGVISGESLETVARFRAAAPDRLIPAYELEQAPFLSEEQKRDILYHNAARFLRLSEKEIGRHHGRHLERKDESHDEN